MRVPYMSVILHCLDSAFSRGIEKVPYKRNVLICEFLISAFDCINVALRVQFNLLDMGGTALSSGGSSQC